MRELDPDPYHFEHDPERRRRQPPLVLRWECRAFWAALRDLLPGLTEEEAAAAFSIVEHFEAGEPETSYSRDRNAYGPKGDRPSVLHTYDRVLGGIDGLDEKGYVDHDRRPPAPRGCGWRSAVHPRPALVAAVRTAIAAVGRPLPAIPEAVLVRRDADGRSVPVPDNRQTRAMAANLAVINDRFAQADVRCGEKRLTSVLRRVFNRFMTRGGRFYAVGISWQSVTKEERRSITIGGEATVEYDAKAIHATMLYRAAGLPVDGDLYELPGFDRDHAKSAFLVMINAADFEQAAYSIARKEWMAGLAELGSPEATAVAEKLIAAVKARHAAIADAFCSDAGARLMRRESDIIEKVMLRMVEIGQVVLPMHDGFVVRRSAADVLLAVFREALDEAGLAGITIEMKGGESAPSDEAQTPAGQGFPVVVEEEKSDICFFSLPSFPSSSLIQDEPQVVEASAEPSTGLGPSPTLQNGERSVELRTGERSEPRAEREALPVHTEALSPDLCLEPDLQDLLRRMGGTILDVRSKASAAPLPSDAATTSARGATSAIRSDSSSATSDPVTPSCAAPAAPQPPPGAYLVADALGRDDLAYWHAHLPVAAPSAERLSLVVRDGRTIGHRLSYRTVSGATVDVWRGPGTPDHARMRVRHACGYSQTICDTVEGILRSLVHGDVRNGGVAEMIWDGPFEPARTEQPAAEPGRGYRRSVETRRGATLELWIPDGGGAATVRIASNGASSRRRFERADDAEKAFESAVRAGRGVRRLIFDGPFGRGVSAATSVVPAQTRPDGPTLVELAAGPYGGGATLRRIEAERARAARKAAAAPV